jgi:hypothetical protein
VGGQSLINSDQTATQLVNGMPLVERTIANKLSIATDKKTLTLQFNPSNVVGAANPVQQPISDIKGGMIVLQQMNYPKEIIDNNI